MAFEVSRHVRIKLYFMNHKNEVITSIDLAKLTNVTDRTIKSDIAQINEELRNKGAYIASKKNKGYILKIENEEKLHAYMNQLEIIQYYNISFVEYSDLVQMSVIMRKLLLTGENQYLKVGNLCEELMISKNVLNAYMETCKNFLGSYQIKLLTRPGYGTRIEGEERHIRMCMIALYGFSSKEMGIEYIDEPFYDFFDESDFREIRKTVKEILCEENYTIYEEIPEGIYRYLILARSRMKCGFYIHFSEVHQRMIDAMNQKRLANRIAEKLEAEYSFKWIEDEVRMLAVYLLINHNITQQELISQNLGDIAGKIFEFYERRKRYIYDNWGLPDNREADQYLLSVLAGIVFRDSFGMQSYGSLTGRNQDKQLYRYPVEFGFALELLNQIEETAHCKCVKRDLTKITFYFMQVFKQIEFPYKKTNLVIISPMGIIYAEILMNSLLKKYGKYIASIQAKELYEIRDGQDNVDLVIFDDNILTHYKYSYPCVVMKENQNASELEKFFLNSLQIDSECEQLNSIIETFLYYDLQGPLAWFQMLAYKHGKTKTEAEKIKKYFIDCEKQYSYAKNGEVIILCTNEKNVKTQCIEIYKMGHRLPWFWEHKAKYLIFYSVPLQPLKAKCLSLLLYRFQIDHEFLEKFIVVEKKMRTKMIYEAVIECIQI